MRAFRHGVVVYVVAWLLVLLGASPVTAPFSTFVPGDAPQHGTSEHPSLDQSKTGKDKTAEFVSNVVLLTACRVIAPVLATGPLIRVRYSDRQDALRI